MPEPDKKHPFIPVNEPVVSSGAKRRVREALDTNWLSSAGPFVAEFEKKFADFIGANYSVAVSSGTAALHVCMLSTEIGEGDEVIVPAFTMAATWMAVLYVGAKPIFIDCEPDTYNIDPSLIEEKINHKTKAIMPVHIYGHPVDMDPIRQIAQKHDLLVIEDAAEAHGAEYKGKKCGSLGDIGAFSFYANKIITSGEGGMIVTNNKNFFQEAQKYRNLYHSRKRFIHTKLGYNYRMTNLQAAVGLGELENIENYLRKKQHIAILYKQLLQNVPGLTLPTTKRYATNVHWMYAVLIDPGPAGITRDQLRLELKDKSIGTRDFFYPPTQQPLLEGKIPSNAKYPVAEKISKQGLYLPSGLAIDDDQIKYVARQLKAIISQKR